MDDITHISVGPSDDADPAAPAKAVYVEPPAPDALDAEPFASGRHRLERTPDAGEALPTTTLWSWSQSGV
jgi:hypothetical protein